MADVFLELSTFVVISDKLSRENERDPITIALQAYTFQHSTFCTRLACSIVLNSILDGRLYTYHL